MTWLTWRQFRTKALVAGVALGVLAVVLTVAGLHVARLYAGSGIAACRTSCGALAENFLNQAKNGPTGTLFYLSIGAVYVLPALIGAFWGAPLIARELESGTYRLAWNQSVTRGRWLAAKLLGVGLAGTATAGLASLAVSWWASPIDRVSAHRMTPDVFGARGVVPVGYAAFAFALGVTAGLLLRRTVPAMAVTFAIVVAAQLAMPLGVRAHLLPPVHDTRPLDISHVELMMGGSGGRMKVTGAVEIPGVWVVSNDTITSTGAVFAGPADPVACAPNTVSKTCMSWIASLHLRQSIAYQPAGRFWPLQLIETSVFLALAAILAAVCGWWVRRRLT